MSAATGIEWTRVNGQPGATWNPVTGWGGRMPGGRTRDQVPATGAGKEDAP
jgi:hypothetical protein